MQFIADLHIHSRFSRATAKTLDFENLYIAAREKGIQVVATGDFTHPAWFAEIQEKLIPAEEGLFRLKPELEAACEEKVAVKENFSVRFLLSCEISSIYKKNGVTRKTHNLILLPDTASAARLNSRLSDIGNIRSDGRPILGLDSRDLLEILLETTERGCLIPAHIWTPWFSLFGSKSGFDRIEECFEDLTHHVFALETGLSSDPPMNWRVGNIDGLTLVSNSDAHSPANLGREANIFHTELTFSAIREALETGNPELFCGTIEFFPEEGKYHQDGHRKCGVNLHPREAVEKGGLCPVCGHALTLGVLHRVEELATRNEGEKPEKTHPFHSVIPLAEIISEIAGTGPKSKKVQAGCRRVQETLGPELFVLHSMPLEAIDQAGIPLLTEAIRRMRSGDVHISAGFDGQYGAIKVFTPAERDRLIGQQPLFPVPETAARSTHGKHARMRKSGAGAKKEDPSEPPEPPDSANEVSRPGGAPEPEAPLDLLSGLNPDQERAVLHARGPVMIVAGPGTGKTRTLTCRIAHLIQSGSALPGQILALTFTNKAAQEMGERLSKILGASEELPFSATFHSFCLRFLKESGLFGDSLIIDDDERMRLMRRAVRRTKEEFPDCRLRTEEAAERIVCCKQQISGPDDELSRACCGMDPQILAACYRTYQEFLDIQNLCDYEDLIFKTVIALETDRALLDEWRTRFPFIFIDEYQDLNYGQYRIVRTLTDPASDICVIGDPDQSIYGFRGSDLSFFERFTSDYPEATQIRLTRNYRSTETILEAAHHVMGRHSFDHRGNRIRSGIAGPSSIRLVKAPSEATEAVAIGKSIEAMIGGSGFSFDDFGGGGPGRNEADYAFSDFAVLFRTRLQEKILAETFEQAGIPFQVASRKSLWRKDGVKEALALLKLLEGCGSYLDLETGLAALCPEAGREEIRSFLERGEEKGLSACGLMAEAERSAFTEAAPAPLLTFFGRMKTLSRHAAGLSTVEKLSFITGQPELKSIFETGKSSQDALERVLAKAEFFEDDTPAFIETTAIQDDLDVFDSRSQKVALLTLHAAKGLEFPVIFVAGCENGLIPFHRGKKPADPAEERRLFYVAMTRAKTHLILTCAANRRVYGRNKAREPSPFLAAIDPKLLSNEEPVTGLKRPAQEQLRLF
jgi:uncharacterized protein (TIGR00375 family)